MKKEIILILTLLFTLSLYSENLNGVKIYINPGHGGYNGANDRNVETIPFALNDTLGFWESSTNLTKGLRLRELLLSQGATVYMSRVLNRDEDDRPLSEIAEESNACQADAFLSIHSNAVGSNKGTNYPLLIYRGTDTQPDPIDNKPMALNAWPHIFNNLLTCWTNYSAIQPNCRGDYSFYGYHLGVLKTNMTSGFLSEGSFHDYKPETHRLLNKNYCKLESLRFLEYFDDYFKASLPATGTIAGWAKDKYEEFNNPLFTAKTGTDDIYKPINGAVALLYKDGSKIASDTVDNNYNGVFCFFDITPGSYNLIVKADNYNTEEYVVTVNAGAISYIHASLIDLNYERPIPPMYPQPDQEKGVLNQPSYHFNSIISQEVAALEFVSRMAMHNNLYYILLGGKIFVADQSALSTMQSKTTLSVDGITFIDFAFSSDNILIGFGEKEDHTYQCYSWKTTESTPELLFETKLPDGFVLEKNATLIGASWKFKYYIPVKNTVTNEHYIAGCYYQALKPLQFTYQKNPISGNSHLYPSPFNESHIIVTSEESLPTDLIFKWDASVGSLLPVADTMKPDCGINANAQELSFFYYASHLYLLTETNDNSDIRLFDVTNGLNQAIPASNLISPFTSGSSNTDLPYLMMQAKVTGYSIQLQLAHPTKGVAILETDAPRTLANIYASELKATQINKESCQIEFVLNENASDVLLEILDNNIVKTFQDLGSLNKGIQKMTIDVSSIPEGTYNWRLTASASPVIAPVKYSDDSKKEMQYFSPRGVAIDNDLESPYFGRIYAAEATGGTVTKRTTTEGIFILNAAFEDITHQGVDGYKGNINWGTSSAPFRPTIAPGGDVFITDWSDTNPGVFIMDPAQPANNFKSVFKGEANSDGLMKVNDVNIAGSISSCWITGTGSNRILYTFDEDYYDATATSPGNLLQYNIGLLESPWTNAPSAVIYDDKANGNLQQNGNSVIIPDDYGWWISQYRSADAKEVPSLIHINKAGKADFNSGNDLTLLGNSVRGGMAIHPEKNLLAFGCNNEIKILDISYNDGIPSLTQLYSIKPALGKDTWDVDFDRAGNVYAISNTNERLGAWALPKLDNKYTTVAPSSSPIIISNLSKVQNLESLEYNIYPNPAKDYIQIRGNKNSLNVAIYDLLGKLILRHHCEEDQTMLNIKTLPKGTLLLKVNDKIYKLIKE